MKTPTSYIIRHVFSTLLAFPALILIWGAFNPLLNRLVTGEVPEVIFLPESAAFNCGCALFFLVLFFIPIATMADVYLIRQLSWRPWFHFPAVAVAILLATALAFLPMAILLGPIDWLAFLFAALDNVIWGSLYWLLFVLSGYFLEKAAEGKKKGQQPPTGANAA